MGTSSVRTRVAALAVAVAVGPAALLAGAETSAAAASGAARDEGKNLVLRPGAVGKAKVGTTIKQAMRTGLFKREGQCGPLRPKGKLNGQFGTYVHRRHLIGMKIFGKNIRTAKGAGIGTRLRDLRSMYGKRLSQVRRTKTPDPRWAVYLRHNKRWLGFLLGGRPREHAHRWNKVIYMEVSRGKRPYLYGDGC